MRTWIREWSAKAPSWAGTRLPERIRSTTFAMLGLTVAAGLGLIVLFSQPGWPLRSLGPLTEPSAAQQGVSGGVALPAPLANAVGRFSAGTAATEPVRPGAVAHGHPTRGGDLSAAVTVGARSPRGGDVPQGGDSPSPQPTAPAPVTETPAPESAAPPVASGGSTETSSPSKAAVSPTTGSTGTTSSSEKSAASTAKVGSSKGGSSSQRGAASEAEVAATPPPAAPAPSTGSSSPSADAEAPGSPGHGSHGHRR